MSTTVTITLTYDGCGLEVTDGIIYSVGNQNVDATVDTSNTDCDSITVTINGDTPPVEVCDGETITVSVTSDLCDCTGGDTPTCEPAAPPPMYLRSALQPNGKMKVWLERNSKLDNFKRARAINDIHRRMLKKQMRLTSIEYTPLNPPTEQPQPSSLEPSPNTSESTEPT